MRRGCLASVVILVLVFVFISPIYAQEVFFSPKGGCTEKVIEEIDDAQAQIDVAMYSFTSEPIAEAFVRALERGVKIRILLDKQQAAGQYSKDEYLIENGLEVIVDIHGGYMHNKICIIDTTVLITGSFNWSKNAEERNEENMLVFTHSPVVEIYRERFTYLWEYNGGPDSAKPATWGQVKKAKR